MDSFSDPISVRNTAAYLVAGVKVVRVCIGLCTVKLTRGEIIFRHTSRRLQLVRFASGSKEVATLQISTDRHRVAVTQTAH